MTKRLACVGVNFVSLQRKSNQTRAMATKKTTTKETKKGRKGDGAKERKANWREYTATVDDIQSFLIDRVMLRHNVVTG